jgi:hypothetical protein
MTNPTQLRPLGIGDLFDTAFRLYRQHFWQLIAIAALTYVPMAMVSYLLWSRITGSPSGPFGMFGVYAWSFAINAALSLTLENVLNGALATAISRAYLGQPLSILGAYRFGLARYLALVVASIVPFIIKSLTWPINNLFSAFFYRAPWLFVVGPAPSQQSDFTFVPLLFFCGGALLAFGLGVLLLYAYFLVLPQTIVLEGCAPRAGLRRSWWLVRGSAQRALGIVVATEILSFLIARVPQGLLFMFTVRTSALFDYTLSSLAFGAIAFVGQVLLRPILLSIFTVFYYDLRVRKEAFDLELITRQMAAP